MPYYDTSRDRDHSSTDHSSNEKSIYWKEIQVDFDFVEFLNRLRTNPFQLQKELRSCLYELGHILAKNRSEDNAFFWLNNSIDYSLGSLWKVISGAFELPKGAGVYINKISSNAPTNLHRPPNLGQQIGRFLIDTQWNDLLKTLTSNWGVPYLYGECNNSLYWTYMGDVSDNPESVVRGMYRALYYWPDYETVFFVGNFEEGLHITIRSPYAHETLNQGRINVISLSQNNSHQNINITPGILQAEYRLSSFSPEVKNYIPALRQRLIDLSQIPGSNFNLLLEGPPGTGKTRFTAALAKEILIPLGFFVFLVDHPCARQLEVPEYIDKLCVIINDVDNLVLDRGENHDGNTEVILSWLDRFNTSLVQPLHKDNSPIVVNLLTANTTERWDQAGLREGRIHQHLYFSNSWNPKSHTWQPISNSTLQ